MRSFNPSRISQQKNFCRFRYARENGFPHLEWCTLPRLGAVKTVLDHIGPNEENGTMRRSGSSRLQLLKDTVGAIREKKYVKGLFYRLLGHCQNFNLLIKRESENYIFRNTPADKVCSRCDDRLSKCSTIEHIHIVFWYERAV